jgi:hypothetical protein
MKSCAAAEVEDGREPDLTGRGNLVRIWFGRSSIGRCSDE